MCGGFLLQTPVLAQKTYWSLFPTEIEFPSGTTSTLLGSFPSGAYYAENSVHLDDQLQFYVRNSGSFTVLDRFGDEYFPGNNALSGKELEIVPVPGSCDTYCVMFMKPIFNATSRFAYFEVRVNPDGTLKVFDVKEERLYGDFQTGIAVSKRIDDTKDRDIYVAAESGIERYTISTAGIAFQETINLMPSSSYSVGYVFEADLSPNGQYLAWGGDEGDVYVWDFQFSVLHEIALPGVTFNQQVIGVEFHTIVEGGTSLYASMEGHGVYEVDGFETASPTVSLVPNSSGLSYSQLELALDGLIYAVHWQTDRLTTIDPLSNTINTLTITVNSDLGLVGGGHALPQQIDGELDAAFYGVDPPSISGLSIETTALPNQVGSIPTFLNCNQIGLDFVDGGDYDEIDIEIVSVNPSDGTPLYGSIYLDYSTTLPSTTTLPIDLRCLDDLLNCDLFDNYLTQTFRLTVTIRNNTCITEDSVVGLFEVTGGPTPISIDFKMDSGTIGIPLCQSNSALTSCPVGNEGLAINATNSTGDVTYYRIDIQEVDCTEEDPDVEIGSPLLQGTNVTVSSAAGIFGSLNSLVINGSQNYFEDNPNEVHNKCFRIDLYLGNECREEKATNYFIVDPLLFLQGDFSGKELRAPTSKIRNGAVQQEKPLFYPNPFSRELYVDLSNLSGGEYRLCIYNIHGQAVREYTDEGQKNKLQLEVERLPAGIYFYQLSLSSEQQFSGRLIKQ